MIGNTSAIGHIDPITLNDLYLSNNYENSFINAQIVPQKNTEYILYLKPQIFPQLKKFEYK